MLVVVAAVLSGLSMTFTSLRPLVTFIIVSPGLAVVFAYPFIGLLIFVLMIPFESSFLGVSGGGALTYTRLIGIFIFAAWIIRLVFEKRRLKLGVPARWLFLFFIWAALSIYWASYQGVAVSRLLTFVQMIGLYLLVVNEVDSPRKLSIVINVFFASSVLTAILVLLGVNVATYREQLSFADQSAKEFATYLGVVFLISTVRLAFGKGRERILTVIAMILCAFPLLASAERGVFVGLGVSFVAILLVSRQKLRLFVYIALGLAFLYLVLQLSARAGLINENILNRYSVQQVIASGGSNRLDIWKVGLSLVKDNLWIGVGLENFVNVFYRYIPVTQTQFTLDPITDPHSDYLRVAGELGVVGLGLFLGWLVSIGFPLTRTFKRRLSPEKLQLMIIVLGFFFFFLTNGVFSTFIWRKSYWLSLGLVTALPFIMWDEPHTVNPESLK